MLILVGFLGNIFDIYLFTKILKSFCRSRFTNKVIFYIVLFLFTLLSTALKNAYPIPAMLFFVSVAMAFIFSLLYKSWRHVAFSVIFWTVLGQCSDWFVGFTMSIVLKTVLLDVYVNPAYAVVGLFFSLALKYSIYYLFLSKRYTEGIERAFSWYQYIFFVLSFIVLINAVLIFNQLIDGKPISSSSYVFLFLAVILFFLSVLFLFDRLILIAKETTNNRIIATENKNQQQFLAEIETVTEYLKELKHDYRHHLEVLNRMVTTSSYEAAEQYVNIMTKDYERLVDFGIIHNKPALSLLIMEKIKAAKANGIEFTCNADNLLETNISDTDLNSIICNLLDNAVEATKKQLNNKKIELNIYAISDTFFIELSNTYDGVLNIRNERYMTTKGNKNIHGYGLRSVERIVDANDGILQITTSNHIFKVLVGLPLIQQLKKA